MVVQGTYMGLFLYLTSEDLDLEIYGGFDPGCATGVVDPTLTVLDGDIDIDGTGDGIVLDLGVIVPGTGNIMVDGLMVQNGLNQVDQGGCIRVFTDSGTATVNGNIATSCEAVYDAGIAVESDSGDVIITNNIAYGNTATNDGGGIGSMTSTGQIVILNNTIADNTATNDGGGLAIYLMSDSALADIENNIIWNNTASTCGDVTINADGDFNGTYASVLLDYNDTDTVSGVCSNDPGFTLGVNNINSDPQFVDSVGGDYHIQVTSPAKDFGDGTHPDLPVTDIDGEVRIAGTYPDIGADEYNTISFVTTIADKTSPASISTVGTVTFTAEANGDDTGGNYEYQFYIYGPGYGSGSEWVLQQAYGNGNTWAWTPTQGGDFEVVVWTRNLGVTTNFEAQKWMAFKIIDSQPISFLNVSTDKSSPGFLSTVGTVTFTAEANGDDAGGNYEYQFYIYGPGYGSGSEWVLQQAYGNGNTWAWTPTQGGDFEVVVYTRNVGMSVAFEAKKWMFFRVIDSPPISFVNLVADKVSPASLATVGTVTFTADANGDDASGTYDYQFAMKGPGIADGNTWVVQQFYGNGNTFAWTPSQTGSYEIVVFSRNIGMTISREAQKWMMFVIDP
jgi:hypothetical protein